MKKINFLFIALSFMLSACASDISTGYYEAGQIGKVNHVIKGTVISARPIYTADNQGLGGLAGAAIGGVAGSMVGGDKDANRLGAVIGGTAGAVAGSATEKAITKQAAMEYIVETDGGKIMSITQGVDSMLKIGQRVMVIYGNRARVIPYNGQY